MATVQDLTFALNDIARLVPGFPTLTVSEHWKIPESWATTSFPNSERPGVYLFLDAQGSILYVGKASIGLGSRIGGEHIGRNGVTTSDKALGAVSLVTIPLDWQLFFLAAAVEEFLIQQLRPPRNVIGVRDPA